MRRDRMVAWAVGLMCVVGGTGDVAVAAVDKGGPRVLGAGRTQEELRGYVRPLVPALKVPGEAGAWTAEAGRLRRDVVERVVFRGVPAAWRVERLGVVWGEVVEREGDRIRKLRYEAGPGWWAGALMYEPEGLEGKVPAILNVNGHVGGPGMTIDYKQARCINLAKRGMLALNLEWIGMGQLGGEGYGHGDLAYLDLCGRAGLSVFYLSLSRGLDVLLGHEHADAERVAVTGLSGGGWQTITISALDERVKLSAPNAGYIGLATRLDHRGDIGDLEQNPSDLVSIADYVHLTAMLAPRAALLIYNVKDDCCFAAERARASVFEPVVPVYALYDRTRDFVFHVNHDPGTHNYLVDNREAFYRFLNQHFVPEGKRIDVEIPVEGEVLPAETLKIEYPADNATFRTLAAEVMEELPRRGTPGADAAARVRDRLREVVRPEAVRVTDDEPVVLENGEEKLKGEAMLARFGDRWTVPVVMYGQRLTGEAAGTHPADPEVGRYTGETPVPHQTGESPVPQDTGSKPVPHQAMKVTTLVLADGGRSTAVDLIEREAAAGRRVAAADVLLTGECMPTDGSGAQWAMMIGAVGRRPVGIQVGQVEGLVKWLRERSGDSPVRVVTKGRMSGLAALVAAALEPELIDALELHEMDASLKDLLDKKVGYHAAPSMFCFGLLEAADVGELIGLAGKERVTLAQP